MSISALALVDGGIVGDIVAVEVHESPLKYGILVVVATTELVENKLEIKFHHTVSTLESREMVMWGCHNQKKSLIPIVSTRTKEEELLRKGEEASSGEDMILNIELKISCSSQSLLVTSRTHIHACIPTLHKKT